MRHKYNLLIIIIKSIYRQYVGSKAGKIFFILRVVFHYFLKLLRVTWCKIPVSKFQLKQAIFQTRKDTIDFYALLDFYEAPLTDLLIQASTLEKITFIDVGAHIGRFSTLVASSGSVVHAFEPMKSTFNQLNLNAKINNIHENLKSYNFGLGNQTTTLTINYSPIATGEASVHHNVDKNTESEEIVVKRFDDLNLNHTIDTHTVIAKIDVEGFELEVIEGMMTFIKEHRPILIVEIWGAEEQLKTYLDPLDYVYESKGFIFPKESKLLDYFNGTLKQKYWFLR